MLKIDKVTLSHWAEFWRPENPQSAIDDFASHRMEMSDEEKDGVDALIARAQMADDPGVETTDAAIVTQCLVENGYHPAFEYEAVISGQAAFERLRDGTSPSYSP
jgi:hypothetical protein